MADNANAQAQPTDGGPTPTATAPTDGGHAANGQATDEVVKLYATKAEAEAAKPASAPKGTRPFEVSKAGAVVGWVLARGHAHAIEQVARIDGYSASLGNS